MDTGWVITLCSFCFVVGACFGVVIFGLVMWRISDGVQARTGHSD